MFAAVVFNVTWGNKPLPYKEISYMKHAYFLKFFNITIALFCILAYEGEWFDKQTIKCLIVSEELIKYYGDVLIAVSFGATITRFSE